MYFIKNTLLVTAFILLSFSLSYGKEETDSAKHKHHHHFNRDEHWQAYGIWIEDTNHIFEMPHPLIELSWTGSQESIHTSIFPNGSFKKNGMIELRLGSITKKRFIPENNILKLDEKFLFLSNLNAGFSPYSSGLKSDIETKSWRFGFGSTNGLGYRLGENSDLFLYQSSGIDWTKTDFTSKAPDSVSQKAIDMYGDAFRFGTFTEGGIRYQVVKNLAIKAGYQRDIVFPRHMFWYWCGSELLLGVGEGLIEAFDAPILKMSPYAAPIVSFILKNGLAYGFYELRKKNMNWPIETVPPFFIDSYKVSLSFSF